MIKSKGVIKKLPLILSFVFLFNPNVTVFDFIPDFIGYALLCIAITRLTDLSESVYEAYRIFKRMIFVDAAKLVAIFWIFGMTVPGERNTSILLWTFVFSVIELICLIPAYSKLYNGIMQIGYLIPNKCIFGVKKGKTDTVKWLTFIFVIFKSVLCVLPEFADLTSRTYDSSYGTELPVLYDYIGLMRVFALIPVTVMGIVWLIAMIVYFFRMIRDNEFISALNEKYEREILPRRGLFVRRDFATFVMFATVALCFTIDFRIDYYNIIPDVISAGLFALAFIYLQRHITTEKRKWILPTFCYAVLSILSTVAEYYFFSKYYYGAVIRNDSALIAFIVMVSVNILKSVSFFAVIYSMYSMLMQSVKLHTGVAAITDRFGETGNIKIAEALHTELKLSLTYANICAIIYVVSDVCYELFTAKVKFMGLINLACAVLCIGMFVKALNTILAEVNTKYMLE